MDVSCPSRQAVSSVTQPKTVMHDRARGRVLHVHFPIQLCALLDRKYGQRRFVKTTQNQFLFAWVVIDISDGINTGL